MDGRYVAMREVWKDEVNQLWVDKFEKGKWICKGYKVSFYYFFYCCMCLGVRKWDSTVFKYSEVRDMEEKRKGDKKKDKLRESTRGHMHKNEN